MVREILVDWTTINGGGKVSVFYADDAGDVASQRASIGSWAEAMEDRLSQSTSWTVRTTGRVLDTATGTLTAEWSEGTAWTGAGLDPGQPVADAVQALIRWQTGVVVNGRMLKGRTFVPGLTASSVVGGNLSPEAMGILQLAAANIHGAPGEVQVWHRPVGGSGGVAHDVNSSTVWNELAVLRRRRD